MASAKDIRFDQRNVTNTAYQEKKTITNILITIVIGLGLVFITTKME